MLHRPSPSMVVACTALAVALGGTGYAATQLPPDSVGRIQIREGSVGSAQVRDHSLRAKDFSHGAVGSAQVGDGSLRAKDFARGVLPVRETSVVRQASGDLVAAGDVGAVSAACEQGERAMGGGGGFAGPPTTNDKVVDTMPVGEQRPPIRWRVSMFNGGVQPRTPVAYIICAVP